MGNCSGWSFVKTSDLLDGIPWLTDKLLQNPEFSAFHVNQQQINRILGIVMRAEEIKDAQLRHHSLLNTFCLNICD